jgi:hypothetical protein
MIAQNQKKSKKFNFEEVNKVDFSWEFYPEGSQIKEPSYNRFLRDVYRFDPSNHNFDERFNADFSE